MSTVESESAPQTITITLPTDADGDGFTSIWNIASCSCSGDTVATRELAANIMCFLAKKKSDLVVTSSTNAEYLDSKLERDAKLLNDWKPDKEYVDMVAQHAEVPLDGFMMFLKNKKFDPNTKYNATRNERLEWFKELWSVG